MAAPSFTNATAGESDGSGTLTAAYPATILANDLLVLHCAINNDVDTITTPSGWTLAAGPLTVGPTGRSYLFTKVAAGTETGTFPVTWTAVNKLTARTYCFTGTSGTYGGGTITNGSSAVFIPQSLTTDVNDCLALQFVHVPRGQFDLSDIAGETTIDYSDPVGEWKDGAGTDGNTIQLQTSTIATAGTWASGSGSISASTPWGCVGLFIRPTGAAPLVFDGSFESGITNWAGSGTGVVSQSSVQAHGGTKSLYLDSTTADDAAFWNGTHITVTSLTTYTISAWVWTVTSSGTVKIGVNEYNVSDVYVATQTTGIAGVIEGSWQAYTFNFTTAATTVKISPFVGCQSVVTDMYIDDVQVIAFSAPPPSGATPKLTLLGAG